MTELTASLCHKTTARVLKEGLWCGRRQDAVVGVEEEAGREGEVEVVLESGARHAARRGTRRR